MQATVLSTNWRHYALLVLGKLFGGCARRGQAEKGHFEVELKFKINESEAEHLRDLLPANGFSYTTTVSMSDTFLPSLVDGEIMRIRQERDDSGQSTTLFTVKQWVKTRIGKTRKEAESAVPSALALIFLVIGRVLNGKSLLGFAKKRQLFEGTVNTDKLVISIDEVFGLGEFSGWYLEAEILVPLDKDPADYEQPILEQVQSLLGQGKMPVKRSYRDMLVESCRLAGVA